MSGVVDGQSVNALVSNAAWLAKNGDDSTIGILGLNNSAAASSGPEITNAQGALNVLIAAVGGSQYAPATGYGLLPANSISGLTHEVALGVLARLFQASTGHKHTGVDGDGPQIAAVLSLASASAASPLTGNVYFINGTKINISQVGQGIQIDANAYSLQEVLTVGNVASAGIDFRGGAIAGLSYSEISNTGFPPAYPASAYIYFAASGDHLYLRTSASATHRVDTSLAASGSTALYGDILIAASGAAVVTQTGQVITVYAPTQAASGAAVNSLAASGSSALTGAVTLSASGGTTLTEVGQNIQIYSPPGVTFAASGSSALTGAVTLSASGGVVLTQLGQNIQIYAPTAGGGGGGSGIAITRTITQTAHGFAPSKCVYYNTAASAYAYASASADATSEALGIIAATTVNTFDLTSFGYMTTLSGLTPGIQYLSSTVAGGMTTTAPSAVGQVSKPVFFADSATAGYALEMRGVVIAPTISAGPRNYVNVTGYSGYGSTYPYVLRFNTTQANVGGGITAVLNDATFGSSFTATVAGLYEVSFVGYASSNGYYGICVNSSAMGGTPIGPGYTYAQGSRGTVYQITGSPIMLTATLPLVAGDVIRIHTGGQGFTDADTCQFKMIQVSY